MHPASCIDDIYVSILSVRNEFCRSASASLLVPDDVWKFTLPDTASQDSLNNVREKRNFDAIDSQWQLVAKGTREISFRG